MPLFLAKMPLWPPDTDAVEITRSVPSFSRRIPLRVPVTVPVDVNAKKPAPLLLAKIPSRPPDTDAVETVRSVPRLLAWTP